MTDTWRVVPAELTPDMAWSLHRVVPFNDFGLEADWQPAWNAAFAATPTPPDGLYVVKDGVAVPVDPSARLIAAAPELLDALQEAIEWDGYDDTGCPALWLDKARAAIAKARGEV